MSHSQCVTSFIYFQPWIITQVTWLGQLLRRWWVMQFQFHVTWLEAIYYITDESCSFTSAVLWGRIKGRTFWKVVGCVTQCTFNLVPNFGELVSMSCVIYWTFIQTGEDYARLWVRQAQVKVPTICGRVWHVSGLHAIDGMTKFTSGREIGECGHGWEQQILYTVYLTI